MKYYKQLHERVIQNWPSKIVALESEKAEKYFPAIAEKWNAVDEYIESNFEGVELEWLSMASFTIYRTIASYARDKFNLQNEKSMSSPSIEIDITQIPLTAFIGQFELNIYSDVNSHYKPLYGGPFPPNE